jgi:hypothetical protein
MNMNPKIDKADIHQACLVKQQYLIENFEGEIDALKKEVVESYPEDDADKRSQVGKVFGFLKEFNNESQHKRTFSNQAGPDHGGLVGTDLAFAAHRFSVVGPR